MTKTFNELNGYEQWVEKEDDIVLNFSCTCNDFQYRSLSEKKRTGDLRPCKHLKLMVGEVVVRSRTQTYGLNHLTERQKQVLREMVLFICQHCKKEEKDVGKLSPHRIRRGCDGGLYVPNNILVLCESCHKNVHKGEYT